MSLAASASNDWKSFGDTDPYFGVLADDRFKSDKIDAAALDDFFASGVEHVDKVLAVANDMFGFVPRGNALDFGCGVGRLTNAMAAHFEAVIGLDISPGMLTRARADSTKRGVHNVAYADSVEAATLRPETYDFVHSYIVLQHIPTKVGEGIIADILRATKTGGVGAIHFTYGYAANPRREAIKNFVKTRRVLRTIANLAVGRRWDEPAMQMNCYALPRIIEIFHENGIDRLNILRVDDWGNLGVFVFFEKRLGPQIWSNPKRI